jgi:hypothetical protein
MAIVTRRSGKCFEWTECDECGSPDTTLCGGPCVTRICNDCTARCWSCDIRLCEHCRQSKEIDGRKEWICPQCIDGLEPGCSDPEDDARGDYDDSTEYHARLDR